MSALGKLIFTAAVLVRGEGSVFRELAYLRKLEQQLAREVSAEQAHRLQSILNHAKATVPFYKDGHVEQREIPATAAYMQLQDWPIIEKADLREDGENRSSLIHRRSHTKSTGGSTGLPVQIRKDARGIARERAATWLGLGWHNVSFGDRAARLWGVPLTAAGQKKARHADRAMNRRTISVFNIDDRDLERIWRDIVSFQPVWIYGYADALHRLAAWTEATGQDTSVLRTRLIVSTGEPITEVVEADIRRALGVPVQNEYGCGEVGAMAYGCRLGQLHMIATNVLVEIIRPDGSRAEVGEVGEVVVTDLTNYAMPLIRYRLGDRSSLAAPCSCGLPWPTLQRVEGRAMDLIVTASGRRIYGAFITYHMRRISDDGRHFQQYQFIQTEPSRVDLLLRSAAPIHDDVREEITRFGLEHLDGTSVHMKIVDSIPRESSGKLRIVKNNIVSY